VTTSRVLALLAAVLVQWRVVLSSLRELLGPTTPVVAVATLVLLVVAATFVVAAGWYAVAGTGREWLARALGVLVVVMAAYLVLGLALGRGVPWTAYAVLVVVAALGGGALVAARPRPDAVSGAARPSTPRRRPRCGGARRRGSGSRRP
jgi:hypothetical protein